MLKLPSIRNNDGPHELAAMPSEGSLSRSRPAVTIVGWQELAAELARSSSLPKFRSAALYCEVKLLEALRKYSEADVRRPDRYRVAICTNLLSELSDISGAFNRVLARIRDEIVLAIYSDYYSTKFAESPGPGGGMSGNDNDVVVEQTPYFMVVENLENEINNMKVERSEWIEKFRAREEDIEGIERRVEGLVRSLEAQKEQAEDMRAQLEAKEKQLADARAELAASRRESDQLRTDLVSERDELERVRSSNSSKTNNLLKDMDSMRARLKRAEVERQLAGAAAEMAMHASDDMVPKAELEEALAQCERLREQLQEARARAGPEDTTTSGAGGSADSGAAGDSNAPGAAAGGATGDAHAEAGAGGGVDRPLTPRPTWEELDNKDLIIGSTAEVVSRMDSTITSCKASVAEYRRILDEQMTEEERELQACLLEPEPDVAAQPLEFQSLLSQFDHGAVDSRSHRGLLPIEPFGTGPEVPRYLRYSGRIASRQMQKRDLELLVQDVWAAKSIFDSQRRTLSSLSDFLFFFLRDRYGGRQAEVSTVGYNMQLMLQAHAYDADVELFLKVLNGEVSEEIRFDRERMVSSLYNVFKESDTTNSGRLPKPLVLSLLQRFFPNKAVISLKELVETLREAEEEEDEDGGETEIVWPPLFEADLSLNDTPFLEAVKDQHLAEINEYVSGMEATLFALEDEAVEKLSQEKVTAASPVGSGPKGMSQSPSPSGGVSEIESIPKISLRSIRDSIVRFDPRKQASEIDMYMMRGSQLGSLSDLQVAYTSSSSASAVLDETNAIEIGTFFMRLNAGLVKPSLNYNPFNVMDAHASESVVNNAAALSGAGLPAVV